jgi:hypothetical protein
MSYTTINQCANDQALLGRITACAAQEGELVPASAAHQTIWAISSASDVEAAYASALAANNPNPGGDNTVITDQMILSAFQANWPPPAPPGGLLASEG